MIKNKTTVEHIANNRVFQFVCDGDSPIDLVKEALLKFLQYAGQIEDHAKAAQEKAAKEAEEKAEVKTEAQEPDIKPE